MHEVVHLNYSLLHSISFHTNYLNRNITKKKCSLVYKKQKKKKTKNKKSKQFNLYGKLTKTKSNFDSNLIFSKLWF